MKILLKLIIICTILSGCATSSKLDKTEEFIINTVRNPTVSSVGGEWSIIGSQRNLINQDAYLSNLNDILQEKNGVLDSRKITETARVVIALNTIGLNSNDIFGYDLFSVLKDVESAKKQGINAIIYCLIGLESSGISYEETLEDIYLSEILSNQLKSGGFSLDGEYPMVDVTAMALQALSYFKGENEIAINKALDYLSCNQQENGGFIYEGTYSSATVSQVIIALNMLEIDINDDRFVKSNNLLEMLDLFEIDGGYKNQLNDEVYDLMATEQALCALVSNFKKENNLGILYEKMDFYYS